MRYFIAAPQPSRSRFNSIDSGLALSNGKTTKTGTMSSMNTLLSCLNTSDNTPLDVPPSAETQPQSNSNTGTGSIAIRAMKSMRSLARMKSWATLTGSISTHPNNDKEGSASTNHNTNTITSSKKIKEKKTEKKDEKKDERKKEKKEGKRKAEKEEKKVREKKVRDKTLRYSGSSFEAGAPSTQTTPVPPHSHPEEIQKTAKKKQSILGLGLPSTRLGTVRTFSNASSASSVGPASNSRKPSSSGRLSVDSAPLITNAQARPSSLVSTNSSLRPPSTASGASVFSERSQRSSSGSAVSIRWDEEGIRNAKAMQRKERKTRKEKDRTTADSAGGLTKRGEKESKRSSESKRRVPISEIFPGTMEPQPDSLSSKSSLGNSANPIVTVEEATVGGHSYAMDEEEGNKTIMVSKDSEGQDEDATPVHRIRPRPLSEQPLSKSRPQGMHNDGDGKLYRILLGLYSHFTLCSRCDLDLGCCDQRPCISH